MTNCCHCGSPILGKSTMVRVKEFRVMEFHEDPKDCYVTEPITNHHYPDIIKQQLIMVGVTE